MIDASMVNWTAGCAGVAAFFFAVLLGLMFMWLEKYLKTKEN